MGLNYFRNSQNWNSLRLQARSKFNNELSSICSSLSDDYINFICNLYSELDNQVLEEDSVFLLACREFKYFISKSSSDYYSNMMNSHFKEDNCNISIVDFCNELIYCVFRYYCDAILDSYKTVSFTYLGGKIKESLDEFSSTETFCELGYFDYNYLKSTIHRLKSLNKKLCDQHEYMYNMFQDEYMNLIVYNLKDYITDVFVDIFSSCSSTLLELGLDNSYVLTLVDLVNNDYDSFSKKFLCYKNELEVKEMMEDCSIDIVYNSYKIDYIDDYKKLNKLAFDSGYSLIRSNGDHGIFKNENGDVVVIPQGRSVGKGLSLKIQKVLLNAC